MKDKKSRSAACAGKVMGLVIAVLFFSGCTMTERDTISQSESTGESAQTEVLTEEAQQEETSQMETPEQTAATEEEEEDIPEGKVLRILCCSDELKTYMERYYPGYEVIDEISGKIEDVTVSWTILSSEDEYEQYLTAHSAQNEEDEEPVDLFLVTDEGASYYADAEKNYALPLSELGITQEDLSMQFQYTQDIVTDADGKLRGVSWMACSGAFLYNSSIAQTVFGSDDPEVIQSHVSDWSSFMQTAQLLSESGYQIVSSVWDLYRVCVGSTNESWVLDENILTVNVDIAAWVSDAKTLLDMGAAGDAIVFGTEWSEGLLQGSNVFGYFCPLWMIQTLLQEDASSIASLGGWRITQGPAAFYQGGTWIMAARETDNPTLVRNIMLTMTADYDVMMEMAINEGVCVNNSEVLLTLSGREDMMLDCLGGMNPYAVYETNAGQIDRSGISVYDAKCAETFSAMIRSYLKGSVSYEEAESSFYEAITLLYPQLRAG